LDEAAIGDESVERQQHFALATFKHVLRRNLGGIYSALPRELGANADVIGC